MRKFMTSVSAVALGLMVLSSSPAAAESLAGSYLAGRSASLQNDFASAAAFYAQALARDPQNVELMDNATLAHLALGDVDKALPLARALLATGQRTQTAHMVTAAGMADAGEYALLAEREIEQSGISPWVDGLVRAWALIGADEVDAGLAQFDAISGDAGMQGIVAYHKALALGTIGRYDAAEALFAADAPGAAARTRRGVLARAEILSQLGRNDEAVTLIAETFDGNTDRELDVVLARLAAGEALPFTHAPTARAGLSEVYYTFAALLRAEQANDYYTLLYIRIAQHLRPDNVDAVLLTADLLENLDQYDLAIEEYRSVPADDPAFYVAELGRAAALRQLDKVGQAIEVLEQLGRSHPEEAVVHSTLGDTLRAQDEYGLAVAAYGRALDLVPEEDSRRWSLHFSRGIAFSQDGDSACRRGGFSRRAGDQSGAAAGAQLSRLFAGRRAAQA